MNPVLVEAWRGNAVESAHRGALAVVDADGGVVLALGDTQRPIFPRSAVKVLQALPLVASGAAETLQLSDEELALACASHNGEPAHVATAAGMLAKAGVDLQALECGTHWPYREAFQREMAARGETPPPAQQLLGQTLRLHLPGLSHGRRTTAVRLCQGLCARGPSGDARGDACAASSHRLGLVDRAAGIDGCSIPTFGIPLQHLARAFARLGTGIGLSEDHARPRSGCARRWRSPVHGRRHRPLRHAGDAAAGRARILQGRRRRRVLRRPAGRVWAWR